MRLAHVDVGSGPPVLIADFVDRVDELPVGRLVRRGCAVDPRDEVAAAYDAPFPSEAGKAGARAFPGLIPLAPDDPGASVGRDVLAALRSDSRPVLLQEDRGGEIGGLIADWLP